MCSAISGAETSHRGERFQRPPAVFRDGLAEPGLARVAHAHQEDRGPGRARLLLGTEHLPARAPEQVSIALVSTFRCVSAVFETFDRVNRICKSVDINW